MLNLTVPEVRIDRDDYAFNSETGRFVPLHLHIPEQHLRMEYSLLAISKWESKWHIPFLDQQSQNKHSLEEWRSFFKCMTINYQQVDDRVYNWMPKECVDKIVAYINDPMTATTIHSNGVNRKKGEAYRPSSFITAEIIYWEMVQYQIPMEWEKRHFHQLQTLIAVCAAKNNPEKMSSQEAMRHQHELHEARKRQRKR